MHGTDADSLSRANSLEHYASKRKSGKRKRTIITSVIVVVLTCLVGAGIFAKTYLDNIDKRIQVTDPELDNVLAETAEPGDPFYMLLLGVDKDEGRSTDAEYGDSDSNYRSDSIMLVRVDPKNVKVTLVSIHRDTMVDLGVNGTQKINAAYSFGGASYAVEVISNFAGVDISHFAVLDMDGFADVVDQVGGVDVTLPVDVYDPDYTGLNLTAGTHHLDGYTAAMLCRARHAYDNYGDGDLYRAQNQRTVIMEVVKKILAADPVTMANDISAMADCIKTDMSVTELMTLAAQMRNIDVANDVMSGMEPTTSEYVNSTWYELVDEEAWTNMMARVDAGLSPYEDGVSASTSGLAAELSSDDDEVIYDENPFVDNGEESTE